MSAPGERPIIFSGESVRAILDGRKTQTRRVVRPQPTLIESSGRWSWPLAKKYSNGGRCPAVYTASREWWEYAPRGALPYAPGDRPWCRETWRPWQSGSFSAFGEPLDPDVLTGPLAHYGESWLRSRPIEYRADSSDDDLPWRRSIHMPRWASRITLEVLDVRAERLQEISEEDAEAEGVEMALIGAAPPLHTVRRWVAPGVPMTSAFGEQDCYAPAHASARDAFEALWDHINGKRAPWASDPWVFVIDFRRVST